MKDQSETFMVSVNPSEGSSFSLHNLLSFRNTIKKKEMKRRFSDEQIKSLEYSFESESRPDSNVKHEIAGKLELHPRQVSIWFQNRRARLKSKKIEREFGLLKADYDSLASSFEALKRENDLLSVQLQKLKSIQANPNGSRNSAHHQHNQREFEESSIIQLEPFELKVEMECPEKVSADDHMNMNSRNGEEGLTEDQSASACDDSLAMASSTIIPFDSKYFLEESSCSSQWWELWS